MFNHRSCFYIYILEQFISNAESNVCFQRLTLTLIMQHWSLHLSRFLQKAAAVGVKWVQCLQATGASHKVTTAAWWKPSFVVWVCVETQLWSFGGNRGNCRRNVRNKNIWTSQCHRHRVASEPPFLSSWDTFLRSLPPQHFLQCNFREQTFCI